jgi:hypothetical protein
MAQALGQTPSSYQHYEDPRKFKRPFLPMDIVRALVPILTTRGISAGDVLALGGVEQGSGEVVPALPAPPLQLVTMQVALPSEAALARMFEGLLRPIDRDMSVAELARTLARRLPTGLAQLQDLMIAPAPDEARAADEDPPAPATTRRASPRAPRT